MTASSSFLFNRIRRRFDGLNAIGPFQLQLNRVPFDLKVPPQVSNLSIIVHGSETDHVSIGLKKYRFWEGHETKIICDHVKAGQTAIDVGANIGYHSILLGAMVGPAGRVISFEPAQDNLRLLYENLSLNNLSNVNAIQAAVSDRSGLIALNRNVTSRGGDTIIPVDSEHFAGTVVVPTVTLNDLRSIGVDRIDFMKMDIQGAELMALTGGMDIIAKNSGHMQMVLEYNAAIYDPDSSKLACDLLDELRKLFDIQYCDPSIGIFHKLEVSTSDFFAMVARSEGGNADGSAWTKDVGFSDLWLRPRQ